MVKPIETIPEGVKHIHCIGIGGSGMFPLVQILHGRGYTITGSDNNESDIVNLERQMGIEVMMGQRAENIQGADLILYSAAIMDTNPELIAARESGLPLWERAKMLGAVSSWYSEALGVCGTHGKTTTTAMIVQILYMAGLDPSAVIGGTLLTGGVGNVFGSFFGVLINGTISSLVKTNGKPSSSWPNVVTALLLCFFIVLQAIFAKVKARRS